MKEKILYLWRKNGNGPERIEVLNGRKKSDISIKDFVKNVLNKITGTRKTK